MESELSHIHSCSYYDIITAEVPLKSDTANNHTILNTGSSQGNKQGWHKQSGNHTVVNNKEWGCGKHTFVGA